MHQDVGAAAGLVLSVHLVLVYMEQGGGVARKVLSLLVAKEQSSKQQGISMFLNNDFFTR